MTEGARMGEPRLDLVVLCEEFSVDNRVWWRRVRVGSADSWSSKVSDLIWPGDGAWGFAVVVEWRWVSLGFG